MKRLAWYAEQFILSNTAWIFFTGVLFASIVLVFQEGRHEWLVYLWYAGKISLLFAPVLLFCGFRKWLKKQLSLIPYILLWSFCFLAYPYLLEALGWQAFIAPPDLGEVALRITGTWFLIAEFAIQGNNYWIKGREESEWIKRIGLEKGILLLTALFAIFYTVFWFSVPANRMSGFSVFTAASYLVQVFIILLVYYCFYLVNHYFLINRVLKEKGVVYYGFAFAATTVLFYPIAAQLISWLPMVRQTNIHPVHNGLIFEDINALVPFVGMLFSIPFILAIKWFRQSSELAALAREKSETELNLLKQQFNPHFFFNTLNNLYAMSLTRDQKAPEAILQLSGLMRYVIYKGKEDEATLAEEVKYIEDYIHLWQIRLHKPFDFRFEKVVADENLSVPPLLFITLVENAFKHGIEPAEGPCFLHMRLKSDESGLLFSCANSFEREATGSGLGLRNLKRRLELLFPGRHELQAEQSGHTYRAMLKLAL